MKKSDENRYPHSADLFKFCKEALNIKHNFEVKVIDQHVGSILGYDPADCSHWKKGKKNIKSLQTINTIATHLDVDPRFVTDIISGKMDLEESIQEYKGYGPFQVSVRYYDELKREYFRNPAKFSQHGESRSFEQVVDLQRDVARTLTNEILAEADIRSCPVMIPEISDVLPKVLMRGVASGPTDKLVNSTLDNGTITISFRSGEMRPHLRYLIAREIGRAYLYPQLDASENDELACARLNLFASLLLIPSELLQKATRQIDHTRDLVEQLADIFWVSRAIMNARLMDFFTHGN